MTTYAQMLELSDPMDCHVRHLGEGSIRVMMWGSVNANPQMLVRLYGSGKLIVADITDVRVAHNPGDPRDGIDIPEDWKPGPVGDPAPVSRFIHPLEFINPS